jgi:RNA polymerase sigma factor (TIGR02999 family)
LVLSGERSQPPATELLAQWCAGDVAALQALVTLVYSELREIAHRCLRQERHGHTLQSTALVNEAYLRLVQQSPGAIDNRVHFLGVAAHVMRQVLVDYARAQRAAKRSGGLRVELREEHHPVQVDDVDVIALDKALENLALLDPQQSRIVELRFFAGLTVEDTATVVGLSCATVKREWASAKAWLGRELDSVGR